MYPYTIMYNWIHMTKKSKSDKTKFIDKYTGDQIDMDEMNELVFKELQKSKFKVDKNGVPLSYKDELYESTARMEQSVIEEWPKLMKAKLYDKLVEMGLSDEEMDTALVQLMSAIAPKFREIWEKAYGIKWKEFASKIKDDFDSMNLELDYPYHYDTLEECSADYVKMKDDGHYKSYRMAWRDAVSRGVTINDKLGNKVPLKEYKQLERAYERIKDLGKEEDYGLEPTNP